MSAKPLIDYLALPSDAQQISKPAVPGWKWVNQQVQSVYAELK